MMDLYERYPSLKDCKDDIEYALSLMIEPIKMAARSWCAAMAEVVRIVTILPENF